MMSSPGRASSAFPLHVLVWNNDYKRLNEELQDQVTAVPGWQRGWSGAGSPKRACVQSGPWCPSLLGRNNLDGTSRCVCWACGVAVLLYLLIWGYGSDVRRGRNMPFVYL